MNLKTSRASSWMKVRIICYVFPEMWNEDGGDGEMKTREEGVFVP